MIVVSDTSPLNYLVLIGVIDVLPQLFGEVHIPPKVMGELQHPRTPDPVQRWAQSPPEWLSLRAPSVATQSGGSLDPGEADAIALALELQATSILIDEKRGRRVAKERGLTTLGTITVLELAAEQELLDLQAVCSGRIAAGRGLLGSLRETTSNPSRLSERGRQRGVLRGNIGGLCGPRTVGQQHRRRLRRKRFKIPGLGTLWSLYRAQDTKHRNTINVTSRRRDLFGWMPEAFDTVIPHASAIARAMDYADGPLNAMYSARFANLYRDLVREIHDRCRNLDPSRPLPQALCTAS